MMTLKPGMLSVSAVRSFLLLCVAAVSVPSSRGNVSAAEPAGIASRADEVEAVRKARVVLAQKGFEAAHSSLRQTRRVGNTLVMVGKPEWVYSWSVRWLQALREMSPKRADQIVALEAHLKRMMELDQDIESLSREVIPPVSRLDAEWYRLEAQLWLAEERAK